MLMEISILLFIISILFNLFKPKKSNFLYGYRTRLSKQSQSNWDKAQRYSSKLLIMVSIVLFVLGLIFKFIIVPDELLFTSILILGGLISVFIFTERHLRES